MLRTLGLGLILTAATTAAVFAHHGWGSYEASKLVTVAGTVEEAKFEMPHVQIRVKASDKTWTVVLAPTSRMLARGATKEMVAVGKAVTAAGYASTVEKDEMRAERITVDGKTVEMR
jgi:hypothetical protein